MNIREFQSASSRDFSLLKAPTTTSIIKNLLQHYAKLAFKRSEFIWNWDTWPQYYSQIGRQVVFSKDP